MRTCSACGNQVSTCWRESGKYYCIDCKQYMPTPDAPERHTRRVVNSDEWVNGVYEHITDHPITITGGKKELKAVCDKYGVMAKALMKPKHRGKGYEMR